MCRRIPINLCGYLALKKVEHDTLYSLGRGGAFFLKVTVWSGEREKILHCMLTGIIYLKIPSKQKTIIKIKLNTKNNQSLEGKKE